MRSIAIMNQKGGVGKTTTAVNVSAALATKGAKVCLIDLDPQANATQHFGIATQGGVKSVYNVLIGDAKLADVRQQVAETLWLVPANLDDMAGIELELAAAVGREMILRDELVEDNQMFDYLLIDCPPSLGLLTLNALTAVKEVFVPIQPEFYSLSGLLRLIGTLDAVSKRLNKELRLSGIILCMYNETRLASEVTRDVFTFFEKKELLSKVCADARVFDTKIRRNVRLAEAPSFGRPIFDHDPQSNGAEDYCKLAEEIAGQVR